MPRSNCFTIATVCTLLVSQLTAAAPVEVEKTTTKFRLHPGGFSGSFRPSSSSSSSSALPGSGNCSTNYFTQNIDHFGFDAPPGDSTTYQERYFVYDKYWSKGKPIFFYCGNEANVELYVNATGLMWENAESHGAMLVFAEHRFYGVSQPFPSVAASQYTPEQYRYLTMEQAIADYAVLVGALKKQYNAEDSAVIGFGGSYGGMLAAWMRMKYPGALDGAIAASAPILAFQQDDVKWDTNKYWQVVTRDATPAAGAKAGCDDKVRQTWPMIDSMASTESGRKTLQSAFKLCKPLESVADVLRLKFMMLNAWDTMAMGNFPFPSDYLVFQQTQLSNVTLPAWPIRVSCDMMMSSDTLFEGMRDAAGILYNVTKDLTCYDIPDDPNYDGIWDYQWCTELLPQETYFTLNGTSDMFWDRPMNFTAINEHCMSTLSVRPRPNWIYEEFRAGAGVSNIVFSNGLYDPWSSGGVVKNISDSVQAIIIPEGAHHLDLMFSQGDKDPASVVFAREFELRNIQKWIDEKNVFNGHYVFLGCSQKGELENYAEWMNTLVANPETPSTSSTSSTSSTPSTSSTSSTSSTTPTSSNLADSITATAALAAAFVAILKDNSGFDSSELAIVKKWFNLAGLSLQVI